MKTFPRPCAQVNLSIDLTRYTSPIRQVWHLTYDGHLVQIWQGSQSHSRRDYSRTAWAQQGSARRAANRYNAEFRTNRFGYVRLVPESSEIQPKQ